MKDKLGVVSLNYEEDVKMKDSLPEEERSYELPDGRIIQVDLETRIKTTEILFRPSIIGLNSMSITEMMVDSLGRCDAELKAELYKNIVTCGGTSMLRGFVNRIENDIVEMIPKEDLKNDIVFVADS